MDRFRQLLFYYLFPRKGDAEVDKEFLSAIKESFFDSLEGQPIKLTQLSSLNWQNLKRFTIEIWGKYSGKDTKYTLILNLEKMWVENLLVR